MHKQILLSDKYHIYQGTPGIMTIHSTRTLYTGDKLILGGHTLVINAINVNQKSRVYHNHHFYELKFEAIA